MEESLDSFEAYLKYMNKKLDAYLRIRDNTEEGLLEDYKMWFDMKTDLDSDRKKELLKRIRHKEFMKQRKTIQDFNSQFD